MCTYELLLNEDSMNTQKPDFSKIIENNPVGFILRERIREATGGLLSPGYVANLDSDKNRAGIKGRFRVGRKVAYPVQCVIEFLENRAEIIG